MDRGTIFEGPAEPSSIDFPLGLDWNALTEDYETSESDMANYSVLTDPSSEENSPRREEASEKFARIERDIEQQSGIMSDYEGRVLLPSSSYQVNTTDGPSQMFLPPELLSSRTLDLVATPPILQSADLAANNMLTGQPGHTVAAARGSPTTASLSPNSSSRVTDSHIPPVTFHQRDRSGRGRTRLPDEKLKKNQRRHTRPEKCQYCGEGFVWRKALRRHLRVHHKAKALEDGQLEQKDVEKTPCPYCPKIYARPDYVTKHLHNKHGLTKG